MNYSTLIDQSDYSISTILYNNINYYTLTSIVKCNSTPCSYVTINAFHGVVSCGNTGQNGDIKTGRDRGV